MMTFPIVWSYLAVNVTLRQACASFRDDEIAALIAIAEVDRLNGWDWATEVTGITEACQQEWCYECGIAIVEQVYGLTP